VCLQASFLVFDKLKQEGFAGTDDVRLRTSIRVPKSVVGRVIGKGGQNVSVLILIPAQI
jgi:insulin-like growth factor 2 mRNA-binding protein 1